MERRNFLKLLGGSLAALVVPFSPKQKTTRLDNRYFNDKKFHYNFMNNWGEGIIQLRCVVTNSQIIEHSHSWNGAGRWINGYYVKDNIYVDKSRSIDIQQNWAIFNGGWGDND